MTEKSRVIGENHWLSVSHRQNLSHKIKYTMRRVEYLILINLLTYLVIIVSWLITSSTIILVINYSKNYFLETVFPVARESEHFCDYCVCFMTLFNQNKFFVKFMTQKNNKKQFIQLHEKANIFPITIYNVIYHITY